MHGTPPTPGVPFYCHGNCHGHQGLEELQCPNAAEVVIVWAWTIGVVNPVDRDGW